MNKALKQEVHKLNTYQSQGCSTLHILESTIACIHSGKYGGLWNCICALHECYVNWVQLNIVKFDV